MSGIIAPKNKLLQDYIEYYWILKGSNKNVISPPIVSPEAVFDVVLSYADSTVWETTEDQLKLNGSFLSGIRKTPFLINCQGEVNYLAIRFYPNKLHQFLRFPLSEISSNIVELDLLDRTFWKHITEKTASVPDDDKIDLIENELIAILSKTTPTCSPLFENALSHIHSSGGTINVNNLCRHLDIYPKYLEREFKKHIGVTPKFYSRVVRFNRVLDLVNQQSAGIDWGDLVYKFGYYDQPHFIKEFTAFLGHSPEEYREIKKNTAG